MTAHLVPRFDIEGFDHVIFSYDVEDDIALVHIDEPRPAVTEEVDDGWYLRLDRDRIVGLELHGFRRTFLTSPLFGHVVLPALKELEDRTGAGTDAESFSAQGSTDEMPRTTHLILYMIGAATAKYESCSRERAAAGWSGFPAAAV